MNRRSILRGLGLFLGLQLVNHTTDTSTWPRLLSLCVIEVGRIHR